MGISSESKLKSLVHSLPRYGVVTRSALAALGVTPQHTQKYVASGWLESVGVGVFKRSGDSPTWQGRLHALQSQDGLAVHVGCLTALAAEGAGQFVRLGREQVWLFSAPDVRPPLWFRRHRWPEKVTHVTSKFLPAGAAVRARDFGGFSLVASGPGFRWWQSLHGTRSTSAKAPGASSPKAPTWRSTRSSCPGRWCGNERRLLHAGGSCDA